MASLPRFLDWAGDGRIGMDDVTIGLAMDSREEGDEAKRPNMNGNPDDEEKEDEDEDRSW